MDFGLLTTPQLHHVVRARNASTRSCSILVRSFFCATKTKMNWFCSIDISGERFDEEGYYIKLANGFRKLLRMFSVIFYIYLHVKWIIQTTTSILLFSCWNAIIADTSYYKIIIISKHPMSVPFNMFLSLSLSLSLSYSCCPPFVSVIDRCRLCLWRWCACVDASRKTRQAVARRNHWHITFNLLFLCVQDFVPWFVWQLRVINDVGDGGALNDGCGAEHVQKSLQLPRGVKTGKENEQRGRGKNEKSYWLYDELRRRLPRRSWLLCLAWWRRW